MAASRTNEPAFPLDEKIDFTMKTWLDQGKGICNHDPDLLEGLLKVFIPVSYDCVASSLSIS